MQLPFKPHWLLGLAALPVVYLGRRLRNDPQFGADAGAMQYVKELSPVSYRKRSFRNLQKTPLQEDLGSLLGDLYGYLKAKNTQPSEPLPIYSDHTAVMDPPADGDYLTWYGHSALRLETGRKTILLDPMLGEWVAPVPFLGHRFPYRNYNPLAGIGEIDLVVYSHDHYDHLDYDTLMAIKDRVKAYLVPLGVGAHLVAWGISRDQITEVDWWQATELAGCRWRATPARHFSGRSPGTRNKSLWCGFAIETGHNKIFFGGDSGYGLHFLDIGNRLGPFDLTMLDSGQYHDRWKNVHMQPEEAIQANRDLKGSNFLPIHWGAFSLSDHPWNDPIKRVAQADVEGVTISPMVGQRFSLDALDECRTTWW